MLKPLSLLSVPVGLALLAVLAALPGPTGKAFSQETPPALLDQEKAAATTPAQPVQAQPPVKPVPEEPPDVAIETGFGSMLMADQIIAYLRGDGVLRGRRVAVLPFFDLSDLQTTTEVGRVAAEELAAALHFRNFHLAEIRTDDQLVLARLVGESFLTRTGPDRSTAAVYATVQSLSERHNLGGLVVGTYAVLPAAAKGRYERRLLGGQVSLNARLLDPISGAVLAVGHTRIEIDETVAAMLARSRSPLKTIPTQELKARRF